jgi:hypothetical protein
MSSRVCTASVLAWLAILIGKRIAAQASSSAADVASAADPS